MNNTYGYVRVSTRDQNEARQLAAASSSSVPGSGAGMVRSMGASSSSPLSSRRGSCR